MRLQHQARRIYWRVFRPTTLGARCLVLDGESVLLVRHTYEPRWYLPGGGVGCGEGFADAARREVREETTLEVGALALFHLYHNRGEGKNDHVALFVAESFSGLPRAGCAEIAAVGFFPLADLPPDASPATVRRIAEYRGAVRAARW